LLEVDRLRCCCVREGAVTLKGAFRLQRLERFGGGKPVLPRIPGL